ncbi:MAG: hypothetical protein IPG12_03780 [Saprospiraceae bacterium]|nr:hypothetical protein [Saprospiraceae bacterium]
MLTSVFLSCQHSVDKGDLTKYPTLEYRDLEGLEIRLPYIYKYGDKKQLIVYGSNHTTNPRDSQIVDIENKIINFKPDLILYEGDGISIEKTKDATIAEYFEMGWVMYLADSLKINVKNIEPLTKNKYSYLLEKYPKNEVLLATLSLQITMMQKEKEDFKSKYPSMIHSLLQEGFPLKEEEQTVEYFYKIYKDYFNNDFSYDNFDSRTIQSKYNKTSLNKINQDANKYRDQQIIALVENEFKKHNKIYLQIGGWHAIVCEPAFRKITEDN